jgi:hypothetical protein
LRGSTGGGPRRADDEIGEDVAIGITGTGDAGARAVVRVDTVDPETVRAQRGQIDRGAAVLAEHGLAFAGRRVPARVSTECPYDQVGEIIAVDITGAGGAATRAVAGVDDVDPEAAAAQRARGNRPSAGLAEHHVGLAGKAVAAAIGTVGADGQVGQPVTIDIADPGDADA